MAIAVPRDDPITQPTMRPIFERPDLVSTGSGASGGLDIVAFPVETSSFTP
jgi:hypothetical protein